MVVSIKDCWKLRKKPLKLNFYITRLNGQEVKEFAPPVNCGKLYSVNRSIFWFRNNLRIHDNPAFTKALGESDEVIPVYLFEDREWIQSNPKRINHFRGKFILQSLQCLQDSLESMGGNLILRRGKAEEIIPAIAQNMVQVLVIWKMVCL